MFVSRALLALALAGSGLAGIARDKYYPQCTHADDDCCMDHTFTDMGGWMKEDHPRKASHPIIADSQKLYDNLPEHEMLFSLEFKSKNDEIIFRRPSHINSTTLETVYEAEKHKIDVDCNSSKDIRHQFQCINVPTTQQLSPDWPVVTNIEIHPGNWCHGKNLWNNGFRFDDLWVRYNGHFRNLEAHPLCVKHDDDSPKPVSARVGKIGLYCEFYNADVGDRLDTHNEISLEQLKDDAGFDQEYIDWLETVEDKIKHGGK